jgi:glycosyltransferase involved in cell wall biosynthesis
LQVKYPKKILFISHEASRSGAPIVLLHLLNWLKRNTTLQIEILLLSDGAVRPEFEKIGKTFLLSDITGQHNYPNRVKRKLLRITLEKQYKKVVNRLSKRGYDLVYGNTIVSLPWLKLFKENFAVKTLCCVHELSYVLNYFFTNQYLEQNLKLTDAIIAVSNSVKENLINEFNIPAEKVYLHYEFIDSEEQQSISNDVSKAGLGIAKEEFVIGMGGTPEWRKGTDLVIPLALKLTEQYPDFKFKMIWLGAGEDNVFVEQLLYDARKLALNNRLVFLASKPNPLSFINLFDVFVLLSREDPFPLIVLEAAFLKKPVIAFENSGGIPELLKQGAGFLAPYLDVSKMADLIYALSQNQELINKTSKIANELVLAKYNANIVSPAIYGEINKLIESGSEGAA